MSKDKAQVLNAFFAFLRVSMPLRWRTDRDQNETPIIQGEMVSDLLYHLDTHRCVGLGGIHPEVLWEMTEVLTEPLSINYQQSWLMRQSQLTENSKCDAHL